MRDLAHVHLGRVPLRVARLDLRHVEHLVDEPGEALGLLHDDGRARLDLNERPDLRLVADVTAVQIDEAGEPHAFPELYVRGYGQVFVVVHQQAPFPESTARGVASRILMSIQSERVLA